MLGLNSLSAIAGDLLGVRLTPYFAYNFLVEIEGLITGGFMEVAGLESEIKVESYEEGGQNDYIHQFPTRTTYPNLVLSKGLTDLYTFWEWYEQASQGNIMRRNGTILLLDHQRIPAMWWNFKAAYPVKWTGPQLNSQSQEVAVERLELVHCGISLPLGSKLVSASRGAAQNGSL